MKETQEPPPRLAVVLSHPTQYYSPWFRHLAASRELELRVFYLWDFGIREQLDPGFKTPVRWDVDLLSGYPNEFVPNVARDPGTHHFFGLRNPGLTRRIGAWKPNAVLLFGYNWYSHLRVILWARSAGVPLVFRGDSHFIGRPNPGILRKLLLRAVYRQFAAITYVGAANHDYFAVLGVPDRRLFFAPHSVDDRLYDHKDPRHAAEASRLRLELGIDPSTKVFLFAGKLVPNKQPRLLLDAFLALDRPNTALVFVGDGPEKGTLEALVRGREGARSAPKVRFLPFANQSEMPSRYLMADVFVLPSIGNYETWGLAINEAMHMGVPCLVSDRVGCQRDLVTPGETGWVFSAIGDPDLGQAMREALAAVESPERGRAIRHSALTRISGYTYTQSTAGLLDALASLKV